MVSFESCEWLYVQAGDAAPAITLVEKPGSPIAFNELTATGKTVIFGLPGPFTPTCSETYVWGGEGCTGDGNRRRETSRADCAWMPSFD
jgi:hypothetical protein